MRILRTCHDRPCIQGLRRVCGALLHAPRVDREHLRRRGEAPRSEVSDILRIDSEIFRAAFANAACRARKFATILNHAPVARPVLAYVRVQVVTRLATAFDAPQLGAIALVLAALVAGIVHSDDPRQLARKLGPRPQRALAADRFERVDVQLPTCERYWFDTAVRAEVWLWPSIAIEPVVAATAIDRTAWMEVLCDGYRPPWWTP